MIFVTFGTHHAPFDRLVTAIEEDLGGGDHELIVQHGTSRAPRNATSAHAYLPLGEILHLLSAADKVVTHAGVGSILLAQRHGHVPVVVPREERRGEHVDDHQLDLVTALEPEGVVVAVRDGVALREAIDRAPLRGAPKPPQRRDFHQAVRMALHDTGPAPVVRRRRPGLRSFNL